MSQKTRIHEIAKRIGITSAELIEVCQKAGLTHIKHASNAVDPGEAELVRKTVIKLYKPKEVPKPKIIEARPKQAPAPVKAAAKPEAKPKATPAQAPLRVAPVAAVVEAEEKEEEKEKEKAKPVKAKPAFTRARDVRIEARRAAVVGKEEEETEDAASQRRREGAAKVERVPSRTRTVVFKHITKPPVKKKETKIELTLPVTVRELSERMGVSATDIIRRLMTEHKILANINQNLEAEAVKLLGMDYDVEITLKAPKSAEDALKELMPEDRPEDLQARPPVVALLGHVDHGKTSILDRIRHTKVASTEDGGITQSIGAWQMDHNGHALTFVDTPGHEAFTAMRARGAQVTDIVILVVAADDGVMPQTEEAVSHARAAGVPIVVAINKVDKPEANSMRVKQQLAGQGINPEDWGGEVGCVDVSALTGKGIEELIERTLLEAEIREFKGNPNRPATGVVLEARTDPGRGVVANVIVRNGTLRTGDVILCGAASGRVRALINNRGQDIPEAGPSVPVSVSGLNRLPEAGDTFVVVPDLELVGKIAEERYNRLQEKRLHPRAHVTLETLYQNLAAGKKEQLRLIIKADVKGSLEPLVSSFARIETEAVGVRVLHQGVGSVNVSDVLLADASDAVIIAFRVGAEERADSLARERGVEIRNFRVIYDAVQAVRKAMEGLLKPEIREEKLGVAEVRKTFKISRRGTIAGCFVREGTIRRSGRARVIREGKGLHEGPVAGLRIGKEDTREVDRGFECGIKLEGWNDIQVGDLIECFTLAEVKAVLA